MKAKLILTLDGAILREYPLNKDSISIGRRSGNDIQLSDMTVSGRHALLTTLVGNSYVEDLGSTNGTLLNGKPVRKWLLKHGDVIQIGTHQFTFFCEDKVVEPTMFIKAEVDETQLLPQSLAAPEGLKGTPLAGLRILNGPYAKKLLELRKPFNTIGFKGIKMAMVVRGGTGYTIILVKSSRSKRASDIPSVNGVPLRPVDAVKLKAGDLIEVAGFQMEFVDLH